MIRPKGEAGNGDVSNAVTHMRTIRDSSTASTAWPWTSSAPPRSCGAQRELVREVAEIGRLPVVLFTAGGIATPADAAR